MVTTYFVKHREDYDLENAYLVTCPKKRLPNYFQPSRPVGIAHDITDHLVHNSKLHPLVDEMVAIGVYYGRCSSAIGIENDLLFLMEENILIDVKEGESKVKLLGQRDEDFEAFLQANLSILKGVKVREDINQLFEKNISQSRSLNKYVKIWKDEEFSLLVMKSLSKGMVYFEREYQASPFNAQLIYTTIYRYMDNAIKKLGAEIDFKFLVHRKEGHVDCFHKEEGMFQYSQELLWTV